MTREIQLKMPDFSTTESEVKVVAWMVEVGQTVERGQALLEIETDKADMEVESAASGRVIRLCVQPGDAVETGQVIAVVETTRDGETPPKPAQRKSLFARNKEKTQDSITAVQAKPLSISQLVVGERMQKSKQSIPHFYLQTSANAEPIIAAREAASESIAWDAFFVLAAAKALLRYDRMCYRIEGKQLVRQENDAVGVAVSVEDDLYVVPVEAPASKDVEQISRQIRAGAEQARRGDSGARKVRPGHLTITNLGAANVETFTAIINPPEAAILAIGRIKPQVVAHDDRIVVQRRVSLVLSADHRVVNGKYAADFLSAVVEELERDPW